MKDRWHEQIQRYVNGQSSEGEAAALHEALNEDTELRTLYLDYVNLDAALGAMADAAVIAVNGPGRTATFPRILARLSSRSWRWLAVTAACAAVVGFVMLIERRDTPRARPDISAVTAATRTAISQLRADMPPALPAWMSPTASLLDQPDFPP